ncbi:C2H2 type zinc finger domain-containing protein [Paramyrothecium foliicola]|nr:C2H2 type zinc finger domain-containing protein [Paramyrothecium foliicola]
MTTAEQQLRQQPPHQMIDAVAGTYDPDEVVPCNSPLMKPLRLRLKPSPTPPLDIPPAQVSLSPFPVGGRCRSNRAKIRSISGDAVLVKYLGNDCHPEIANTANTDTLTGADDDDSVDNDSDGGFDGDKLTDDGSRDDISCPDDPGGNNAVVPPPAMTIPSLQHLAADALQAVAGPAVTARSPHDISASTRQLSIHDNRLVPPASSLKFPPHDALPPLADLKPDIKSPPSILSPTSGGLPPLQIDSPRSDGNGQSLPSIRSTLGDINRLTTEPQAHPDKDTSPRGHSSLFPRSPPAVMPRLHPMSGHHASPPVSPNDTYPRNLPSPHSLQVGSPYYYSANGYHHRPSGEYSTSSTAETPSTDQSGSTPATSTSVADRMSIDGLTNPQIGVYHCTFAGCNAPPFQTQYLLNSHANVHSSARPHYCPVKGCPRSEGGKGFKRKNEMIRHGLVHDSPGYVCPFCPDREHKYPRPDNLQRYAHKKFPEGRAWQLVLIQSLY